MKNLKKKIITSLGIAVMAMSMFFSTNSINSSNGKLNLANLIAVNTANAEWGLWGCADGGTFCEGNYGCKYWAIYTSSPPCN